MVGEGSSTLCSIQNKRSSQEVWVPLSCGVHVVRKGKEIMHKAHQQHALNILICEDSLSMIVEIEGNSASWCRRRLFCRSSWKMGRSSPPWSKILEILRIYLKGCQKLIICWFSPMAHNITKLYYLLAHFAQTCISNQPVCPDDHFWRTLISSVRHQVASNTLKHSPQSSALQEPPLSRCYCGLLLCHLRSSHVWLAGSC